MLNIGIIGFGKMGRIRCDAIRINNRCRVAGLFDPQLLSPPPGMTLFKSENDLIENPNIQAVLLCTPNYLNKSLTMKALEAGKHVFCEKPPAFNVKEMEQIIAMEKRVGDRKLMYGFNHRHHASVKKMKEMVDSGAYGRILWMRGRYGKSVDQNFYNDWRSKKELAGGGILMDQGIHMLDLFMMLAGDFEEVQAYVSNLYWKLSVEDNVFAILRNKNGVVASLHSTMTQWRHLFSLEIFMEKGYVVLNGLLTNSGTYGEEVMTIAKNRTMAPAATWDDEEHIRFDVDHSWLFEMNHFVEAIENKTPVQFGNSQEALRLMSLVDKIYEQGKRGG